MFSALSSLKIFAKGSRRETSEQYVPGRLLTVIPIPPKFGGIKDKQGLFYFCVYYV
jgi:hypothetical protein